MYLRVSSLQESLLLGHLIVLVTSFKATFDNKTLPTVANDSEVRSEEVVYVMGNSSIPASESHAKLRRIDSSPARRYANTARHGLMVCK